MNKYNHKELEAKWQEYWEREQVYEASDDSKKLKKYILVEFPYPSGDGLHMGHLRPYTAGDVYSRFWRMKGFATLFPMGWDAFGLPAENYAIKNKVHPAVSTAKNTENAKRQLRSWGMGFDWSREVNTTDPEYYKWTQWIFLQLFKAGLAYEATGLINWCPKDKTGLANEEVIDGCCERCGTVVEKKELRQWYLKITAYAEKLLEGLKELKEWPEAVKLQQENWIGKSEGAEIEFEFEQTSSKYALVAHGLNGSSNENWFPWIKKVLEKNYWKVSVPDLPNSDHPAIEQWTSVISNELQENCVAVGQSLGCPAILNAIQTSGKKINKLILVAPVNPNQEWGQLHKQYPAADWAAVKSFADIKFDWKKINQLVQKIIIYYSDNDPYIPVNSIEFYKKNLPQADYKFLLGKSHFSKSTANMTEFPEILDDIQSRPNFLILHGWTGLPGKNFIPSLKKELEDKGFSVQAPTMPNTSDPKESEQVEFVLKNAKINDNTIIVGHSLGGVVAMKALMKRNKPFKGLVLVAPAIDPEFSGATERPFWKHFKWNYDYEKLKQLTGFITILSDLQEKKRVRYLEFLSEKLNASLITGNAAKEHFYTTILPSIRVFTTRVDTLPGATFLVLAPEHPLVMNLKSQILNLKEVEKYVEEAKKKTDIQRTAREKEKTGVELKGVKVVNPANGEQLSIWIADYALMGFGTGALFGDAHDERDQAFAKKYKIPLKVTLKPADGSDDSKIRKLEEVFTGDGILYNSGEFSGLTSQEARKVITKWLVEKRFGQASTTYKLRDWVFSRQRYWGEPIPLVHCEKCGTVAVPEDQLPVTLPEVVNYEPTGTGESPLAVIDEWVNVKCPNCGGPAKRETNTMPQWAGSSWYWLRYTDPENNKELASKKNQKYWTPVDVYFGGMEHTTLHLLYSRFWNLFLYDQGFVTAKEPYVKRVPHGIVLATDGEKMSKSRGNVVNPDDIVEKFGADVMRMYELFLGPHGATVSWNDKGIVGVKRFLDRVYNFKASEVSDSRNIHSLIKKVTSDIEQFKFNTTIAAFMEFLNKNDELNQSDWESFLKLLAPFAPHITEELWHGLGHKESIHKQAWPQSDEKLIADTKVIFVVQVSGKLRATLDMEAGATEEEVKEKVEADENVKKYLADKSVAKIIFVTDKLINFVVK